MSSFGLPFMQVALAAALLAGNALALLGAFVVLRRVSFSGLAVSQLAALGAVAATLFAGHHESGFHRTGLLASLACVMGGSWLLSKLSLSRRVPAEAWVACLYVAAAAAAVLALSKSPEGEAHTMTLFFGNVLSLTALDVAIAGGLLAATLACLGLWLHRWLWLFFDPISAEVAGIATARWSMLFWALFGGAMTLSIHIFGVLLAFAFLILPALTGLLLARSLRGLLLTIPAVTTVAVLFGLQGSFYWDFPTGPFIAALLAAAALAAGLLRLKSH